ncbi:hypothetical protein L7F22_009124 [Adiantum nelumboides]|nr:hypothetical protein [Adiantum nelumboides]
MPSLHLTILCWVDAVQTHDYLTIPCQMPDDVPNLQAESIEDEENKIEDEGDMSQATQQVLPTIDEETPFHKGDTMSTQEVVEHESDFVAQKPSNDMNKGSENMLPTIGETQVHEDGMIIKDTYSMPLRDEKVEGSEKKDEANEEHQGALATTEVQDKVDKGTGEATRNANKAQSIQGRVQGTEGDDVVYDFEKSLGKSKFAGSTLEGKVLCKYGTYKIEKGKFGRYLKANLLDKESKNTITLVLSEIYIADFVNLFEVEDFVCVEGASLKRKVFKDGGTCQWSLHVDAITFLVKINPFDCQLVLYLEHRVRELLAAPASALAQFNPTIAFTVVKVECVAKSDGSSSCCLIIADGPAIIDRASLLFVPSRRVDYHTIVNVVNKQGCFSCVAHNINVFRQQTNTLSVVDVAVLLELPSSLETIFRSHLSKQVYNSGFGKKIFGTLEIINVNILDI